MCGIVGCAGDLDFKAREVFKELLVVCQLRGKDATGAIGVKQDNSYGYAKAVGTPDVLLDTKSFDRNVDTYQSKILIGHCRAKTVGENTARNAHPFDHENVIGVHNGTLKTWRMHPASAGYIVDSDFLYSLISEKGVEEAIPEIEGAYALVWWDKRAHTLNFLKNEERPLSFCWSKDKKMMFWASEPWMLQVVARKIDLHKWGEDDSEWYRRMSNDELWSFTINKGANAIVAAAPKKVEGKKPTPLVYTNTHGHGRAGVVVGGSNNGGSNVTSPFAQARENRGKFLDRMEAARRLTELLNKGSDTPSDTPSTPLLPAISTTGASKPSGSQTGKNISTTSSRPTLSLVPKTSKSTLSNSNDDCSDGCETSATRKASTTGNEFVDFRTVAGVDYVTDRRTGTEYASANILSVIHECSWCHEEIKNVKQISKFMTPSSIICTMCDSDY